MNSIKIKAEHDYVVHLDSNWRESLREIAQKHKKTLVLVPHDLFDLFGLDDLNIASIKVVTTPSGEAAKTTAFLAEMWDECGNYGLTRSDCIVGIGGGSTTDLAGFVAATWLRGISWYAIPTSLAGMVDAAIGGKTGINSEYGKNLIGSFHSPQSVIVDTTFLSTLSERDFNAGLAEVIKAGFISDPKILELVSDPTENIKELIWRSIDVKASVVSADFKEGRLREILNYGHTLGHAVEKLEDYKLRHGEAVAIGLVFAAELSNVIGKLDAQIVAQHRKLLLDLGLPITYNASALPNLLELMAGDKKSRGSLLRFIGLEDIAKPIWIENVTNDQITRAYERISS